NGDRYYVIIPDANAPRAQAGLRGRGFEDVQVQKRGNDAILSFKLQPGTNARVNQKFNRLDVELTTPGGGAAKNPSVTPTPSQTPEVATQPTPRATPQTQSSPQIIPGMGITGRTLPPQTYPNTTNPILTPQTNGANPPVATVPTPEAGQSPNASPEASAETSPAAAPSADEVAQNVEPPAQQPATTDTASSSTTTTLGTFLRSNWLLILIGALALLSVVLIIAAYSRTERTSEAPPPPALKPEVKEKHAVSGEKAVADLKEADALPLVTAAISAPAVASTEQEVIPAEPEVGPEEIIAPIAAVEAAKAAEADETPAAAVVEEETVEAEPAPAVDVERVETEVKNVLAGEDYDEEIIGASDAGTRQLVAAELLSALAARNVTRRERAREVFIKHNYLDEATQRLRTAEAPAERAASARSLGYIKDSSTTPHLSVALEDEAPEVRRAAVEALAELRDPAAREPLSQLLERERDRKVPKNLIRRAIEASSAVEEETPTLEAEHSSADLAGLALAGGALVASLPVDEKTETSEDEQAAQRAAEEEEARRREEEEARRVAEEEARAREAAEEEARKQAEEEARLAAETEARRLAEEEEARHREEEARLKAEEEARLKAEEEARLAAEAEAQRLAEEEAARQRAEEEARLAREEEERRQAEEAARLKAEEEERARLKAEEEERQRLAEEARLKAEEEARLRAEEEERERQAEVERLRLEEEARLRAEEEARRKAEEEEAERRRAEEARLAAEAEAKRLAEEEAARLHAEEEARQRALEEARLKAEEEARLKAEEEERLRAEAEAKRLAEEEEARRREEEARLRAEEARLAAEAEAKRLAEEEAARQRAEEEARLAAEAQRRAEEEEARRQAEEEARLAREEEERRQAEEAARLKAEEEERRRAEELAAAEAAKSEPPPLESLLERGDESAYGWVDVDVSEPQAAPYSTPHEFVEDASIHELTPDAIVVESPETKDITPSLSALEEPVNGGESSYGVTENGAAVKGIATLDEFSTVPGAILKRLSSEEPSERAAAVTDLARVGGDDSFREISAAFDDPAVEVRNAAARSLFNLNTDRAATFTRALREAPPERRRKIGSALASSGLASEAIGQLMGESREKTYDAFSLLFLMSKAGEVQPLMRAIEEHPNNEVRLAVVKLLALSGQQEILPAFRRLAVRGSLPTEVRSAVMEAIYQISSQSPTAA
ncbi:MAG TPA: HEAT repeat domain-containing protein, partial [Pyrinomonadaceae bacterium]